jgi:hypothetical protein
MHAATAWILGVACVLCVSPASAVEPPLPEPPDRFFRKDDIVALVGGEDMAVAAELGFFEMLVVRALPEYRVKFRSLAWEGDTVFEQRRDLNFPSWEEQFEQIGATVVICQFGQLESLAGKAKLPDFVTAFEKLLTRFAGDGKRRVLVLEPFAFAQGNLSASELTATRLARHEAFTDYAAAARQVAERAGAVWASVGEVRLPGSPVQRDGCHLTRAAQAVFALDLARKLQLDASGGGQSEAHTRLLQAITAKNRLWFDYWRVQNWAFLAGDRTVQPSSRDHRDPSKRWFPAEREEFLPLVTAKEQEIWSLATQLAKP